MSNHNEAGSPNRRDEGTPRRMPRSSERGGSHTTKMIGGLNAVVYTNAGGSIVIEIPYAPDDNPAGLCAALHQTLGERDELFPERKKQITDEDIDCLRCKCGSPLFIIMFAESSDYPGGVIAPCQECGQMLEIRKD